MALSGDRRLSILAELSISSPTFTSLTLACISITGDLSDGCRLEQLIERIRPHEVYNLGSSEPCTSLVRRAHLHDGRDSPWDAPSAGGDPNRVRHPNVRFYQASSSEMYGLARAVPQDRKYSVLPAKPICLRQSLRLLPGRKLPRSLRLARFHGVLFNHESPRRGETFVNT